MILYVAPPRALNVKTRAESRALRSGACGVVGQLQETGRAASPTPVANHPQLDCLDACALARAGGGSCCSAACGASGVWSKYAFAKKLLVRGARPWPRVVCAWRGGRGLGLLPPAMLRPPCVWLMLSWCCPRDANRL